jgi:hypothetical protein
MLVRSVLVIALACLFASDDGRSARAAAQADEFAFLHPWFVPTRDERQTLGSRGVVLRALPARGKQIAILAACRIDVSPDAFVARLQTAWDVDAGEFASGRLENPPNAAALARLSLDDGDVDRLRRCRPGDCRLNLSNGEIRAVQSAFANRDGAAQVQGVFRNVIVDRARRYLSGGLGALPDYHDRSDPASPAKVFDEILTQAPYVTSRLPRVATWLRRFPATDVQPDGSYLRWSKVIMNEKAVVRASHLGLFRGDRRLDLPDALVVSKQIYASRYMNGELAMTMLFAGTNGRSNYLVHVDRSELDELGGVFSGLKRTLMEGRIKSEAGTALAALRDRFESRTPQRP